MTNRYPEAAKGEAVWELLTLRVKNDEPEIIIKGTYVTITDGYTIQPMVGHIADAGERIGGVALEDFAQNGEGDVLIIGVVLMELGADVTSGAAVKTDDDGNPVPCLAADVGLSGGLALQKGADGDLVLVLVMPDIHGIGS